MSEPSVNPAEMLIARKTPHNDVVKLLTELVTELRIENEDLKRMLMNQSDRSAREFHERLLAFNAKREEGDGK